ncbi:MAG: gamma-glutamyltransferase [Bacteroidota bacterium]
MTPTRVLWSGVRASVVAVLASGIMLLSSAGLADQGRSATGKEGMVAAAHPLAARAALDVLRGGGNAVDAAVTAAFVVGVVEPDASGLGGGGGMVIHLQDKRESHYINYYVQASERIDELRFTRPADNRSAKAVLVPGTVAGLTLALERFGTLPLARALEPAIRFAEEGFAVDQTLAMIILDNVPLLQKYETTASLYLPDGFPLAEGDTLRQPDLGRTLRAIASQGPKGFYEGRVAGAIVNGTVERGGVLTTEDMQRYEAQLAEPLVGTYRGYEILSTAIPQSGVSIIEGLNILENVDLASAGHFSTSGQGFHIVAEMMRRVYADRSAFLGDPRFNPIPDRGLTSKEYAAERYRDIDQDRANPPEYRKTSTGKPLPYEEDHLVPVEESEGDGGHTTHLTVVDGEGNAVSLTQTLGTFFGSGLTVEGVLLNCGMTNFSTRYEVNLPEARKQPRSSIAPTILLKDGKVFATVGSPGATRIVATVLEIIVNLVDFSMGAVEANDAPRFLCQKNDDVISLEGRVSLEAQEELRRRGHTLQVYGDYDLFFGGAQIIVVDHATGTLHGSADPRRGGVAAGY